LFLDILPVVDLAFFIVVYPFIIAGVFVIYGFLMKPKKLGYLMTMIGIFYLVRAITISLTHIRGPVEAVNYPFMFTSDMFFSGHTGLPFLGFLITSDMWIKTFMILSSVLMAVSVIFAHQHYSIDVASAFFITYGIYKMGNYLYKKFD